MWGSRQKNISAYHSHVLHISTYIKTLWQRCTVDLIHSYCGGNFSELISLNSVYAMQFWGVSDKRKTTWKHHRDVFACNFKTVRHLNMQSVFYCNNHLSYLWRRQNYILFPVLMDCPLLSIKKNAVFRHFRLRSYAHLANAFIINS